MLCLAGRKSVGWSEKKSEFSPPQKLPTLWYSVYPYLLFALCNIASTNGAIWGKYTPNGKITNDSPGAIVPLWHCQQKAGCTKALPIKKERSRPQRWSIFRAMRCRRFIFQQRCDTDYFWKSLTAPMSRLFSLTIGNDYFSVSLLIFGPIILGIFTDWLGSSERKLY